MIVSTFLPIETKAVKTKCQSNLYKSLIYSFILLHRIITADMQNQGDDDVPTVHPFLSFFSL